MRMNGLMRGLVAAILMPVMLVEQGYAWGSDGHKMIDRLAAANLPKDVPEFLRSAAAQDAMEYYGPEPDRWKSNAEPELSVAGSPEHFIDMEWADLIGGPLPRKRYDFIRALAVAQKAHPDLTLTPEGVGLLPWATEEGYERLKAAMRDYRQMVANHEDTKPVEAEIVFLAGILGHYVGDGSQPLHATIKFNGWVGDNPNGYTTEHRIHAQFESNFVKDNVNPQKDIAPLVEAAKPKVFDDVFDEDVKYLRHSNSLVEQTYQFEKAGGFNGAGSSASRAFVDERLAAGAIELRDIIYTAWVKSADPVPAYRNSQKVTPPPAQ
jgi:S1/P1 Nuclease